MEAGVAGSENVALTVVFAVTLVAPSVGMTFETVGGVVSTVQMRLTGVTSTPPKPSNARTAKVCEPSVRLVKVAGEVQALKAASSNLHSNVAPAEVDEKLKLAELLLDRPNRPLSMIVLRVLVVWRKLVSNAASSKAIS